MTAVTLELCFFAVGLEGGAYFVCVSPPVGEVRAKVGSNAEVDAALFAAQTLLCIFAHA